MRRPAVGVLKTDVHHAHLILRAPLEVHILMLGVWGTPMHQKLEVHDYDKLRLSIPNHVSSVPW